MFLNPRAKVVYLNWEHIAPQMVAILRAAAIPGGVTQLNYETPVMPGERGQSVIVYSADRGSPSEEKLQLLCSWSSTSSVGRARD